MCGIAGIISSNPSHQKSLLPMARLLRHRGPDDEGFILLSGKKVSHLAGSETHPSSVSHHDLGGCMIENFDVDQASVGLAHRRLSIIDLSPNGHQPMTRDGKVWIAYNGEAYNYLEVRAELESEGISFTTESDTEVVLAAYERWGTESFSRLNGMWAMAILDLPKERVILSRDRFGIKPLYVYAGGNALAFASEIKSFQAIPGWKAKANEGAIHDFLFKSLSDHTRETFFENVHQLLPGHFASIKIDARERDLSCVKQQPWYGLPSATEEVSLDESVESFRELFLDSVRLRMRSDVRLGSCLSGGLDSSSIVGAMRALSEESKIDVITSCSTHKEFDESSYADLVSRFTNSRSSKVFPDPDALIEIIDSILWHQDEPFGSASIYAQWSVFEKARELEIPVMLDGQGADESHCGYNSFLRPYVIGQLSKGRLSSLWANLKLLRPTKRKAFGSILRGLLDLLTPSAFSEFFSSRAEAAKKKNWYFGTKRILKTSSLARQENLSEHSRFMMKHGLRMLLHWEDRNSMAHSIESRVPFLDYRLMPLIFSLSDNQRIAGGWSKGIIRKAMNGLLPDEIIFRTDKMGFVTPESLWASNEWSEFYLSEMREISEEWGELIGPRVVDPFEKFLRKEKGYDPLFWKVTCLNRWRKIFKVEL